MSVNQYTHRYSLTAADMDTRYRMTPNAAQIYSEWIPRAEQIDVSVHASRK
ncbi:MAG: hypothetical protein IJV61_00710 [Paludibacteraceae bacterium]|nr:hypothetical protein [Paludibacteraceae bacterium]